jgi:hypothetical protein
MSRLGRPFRSRITLALLGMALVGGGGAYWAVTSSAPPARQAGNSLTNTDPTNTVSAEDSTATTDPGAIATATTLHNTPTPRPAPTATPCPASGQSTVLVGPITSVNMSAMTFNLMVGTSSFTIHVSCATTWPGQAKKLSDLHTNWTASVRVISQPDGTYLATRVTAPRIDN